MAQGKSLLPVASESVRFEFDAFISYRTNLIPDGPVGEELQRVLETYPVPAPLRMNIVAPKRFGSRLKIFRDIPDLNAGKEVGEAVKEKLRVSRWLVIVSSPNLPKSTYCLEEIRYFEEYHGRGRTLYLLIAGEVAESIPVVAELALDSDPAPGGMGERLPLAADVRAPTLKGIIAKLRGTGLPKAKQARFKLLAPILGCASPDALIQRHRARVRRLMLQVATAVLPVVVVAAWLTSGLVSQELTRREAERLLTPLGLEERLSQAEVDALWKVASADKATRLEFLRQAVQLNPARFNRRAMMITRAALGIDPSMAKAAEERVIRTLSSTTSNDLDLQVARLLLGLNLGIQEPEFLVDTFRVLQAQPNFKEPPVSDGTEALQHLAWQFWRQLQSLDATQAQAVAKHVEHTMMSLDNPLDLSNWTVLLKALGPTDPELLRNGTGKVLKLADHPSGPNRRSGPADKRPYCQIWEKAPWVFSTEDVSAFTPLLVACLQDAYNVVEVTRWHDTLVRLLVRTPVAARAAATPALLAAMQAGYLAEVDSVIVDVPGLLTQDFRSARVKAILRGIASAVDEKSASGLEGIVHRLAAAPNDVSSEDLSNAQNTLHAALARMRSNDGLHISYLLNAIIALPGTLPSSTYWAVVSEVVRLMKGADSSTSVDLQEIAAAAGTLPMPTSIRDGAAIRADIIAQIGRISFEASFSNDRLKSWLKVLRATGGDLPADRQEAMARVLATKIGRLHDWYRARDLFDAVFALRTDRATTAKIVFADLDFYESQPGAGFNISKVPGQPDWPGILEETDYAQSVRRVARLLSGARKRDGRTLLTFLANLPGAEGGRPMEGTRSLLIHEIDVMPGLSGPARTQLRAAAQRRLPSSTDVANDELLAAIYEGGLQFPEADRQRVVQALIGVMEASPDPDTIYLNTETLQSIPYVLDPGESRRVVDALAKALAKTTYESGVERANRLLVNLKTGFDEKRSLHVAEAFMQVMLKSDGGRLVWLAADGLEALPVALSPADTVLLGERLCAIVEDSGQQFRLESWYRVLAKVVKVMSPELRHRATAPILARLAKLQSPHNEDGADLRPRDELKWVLRSLTQIPGGAIPDDRRMALQLASRILASSAYSVAMYPNEPLEELAAFAGADMGTFLDLLKWPTLGAKAESEVLELMERQTKQRFRQSPWQASRWAQSNGFDVSSPLSRPHP